MLTAMYKTWDGEEWIEASLASIYDHVDAIVMVHSEVSWLGETGNTVREPAKRWAAEHDNDGKIHHVEASCRSQEEQYAAGILHMRANGIPHEVVMTIDSDEVWETRHLEHAKRQIAETSQHAAYRCNMHSYLKTPFYRVHPPYGSPTVFFRDPELLTKSPRGCRAPAKQIDAWMHHYTYVRKSRDLVWRKIQQSCHADGGEVVVENWMSDVYDKLPDGKDLHAFVRWRNVWQSIVPQVWSDLPQAVRECEFIKHWWPESLLMHGEINALADAAMGRRMAIDLGTFRGSSAVILSLACERVHTVDAYETIAGMESGQLDDGHYRELWKSSRHRLESVTQLFDRFGNITAEKSDTAAAGLHWPGQDVDFLFIDADHSAHGTMANVQAWWPNLLPGARIVFHDYNELHPGVQYAVDELAASGCVRPVQLSQYSGSLVAFEKIGDVRNINSDLQAAAT